jgi:hypothetical protein
LRALREWAWARGRTDIVLDLDVHDSVEAFLEHPSWARLVHVDVVVPSGFLPQPLRERVRELAVRGTPYTNCTEVREPLADWFRLRSHRLAAAMREMNP